MGYKTIQQTFGAGVIDPKLQYRSDIQFYQQGLAVGNNVLINPQGNAQRRPGSLVRDDITTARGVAATKNVRQIEFDYGLEQRYTIVVHDADIEVYQGGVFVTSTGSSPFTNAQIAEITWFQAFDVLFLFHKDVQTQKVTRTGASTFTIGAQAFDEIPLYQFAQTVTNGGKNIFIRDPDGRTYAFSATRVAITDTQGIGCVAYAVVSGGAIASVVVVNGGEDYDSPSAEIIGMNGGSGATLTVTTQAGVITAIGVSAGGSGYSDGEFAANLEGQYLEMDSGEGRARIIEYISTTCAKIAIVLPFFDNSEIAAADFFFDKGYEPVWSGSRGWPRAGVIWQDRFFLAGSASLPDTIWASRTGLYFNFDNTRPELDDFGFQFTLSGNQVNEIQWLIAARTLEIFTAEGEFTLSGEPITPTSAVIRSHDKRGILGALRPQRVDGSTLFMQRRGKALREFIFDEGEQNYIANNISLLSAHLLNDPQDMALRKSISTSEADYLIIVNGDGTLAVLCTLRRQQVTAWTTCSTDGLYRSVSVEGDKIFFVVQRTINGSDKIFFEEWDEDTLFDCAIAGTGSGSSIGSLGYIEGEEVYILTDGILNPTETVASGSVTPDRAYESSFEVGLGFFCTIEDLPVALTVGSGSLRADKKRVARVAINFFETQNATVNGRQVSFRQLGSGLLDQPVTPYTGEKEIFGLLGWDRTAQITIGQSAPLKFNVRGFVKEVEL